MSDPQIIPLGDSDNPEQAIVPVIDALHQGHSVGVRIDCRYVLISLKTGLASNNSQLSPLGVAVRDLDELIDIGGEIPVAVERILSRCWPGPICIDLPVQSQYFQSLADNSSDEGTSRIRCWCPGDAVFHAISNQLSQPAVLYSCIAGDGVECRNTSWINDLSAVEGSSLAYVLDLSDTPYHANEAILRASPEDWEIMETGPFSPSALQRQACKIILFVCTGNTCRSPMAEGIFRQMAAERLHCSVDELEAHGLLIGSAGLSASFGAPASREAVQLTGKLGIDLTRHQSQPLTERLALSADAIFAMTRQHLDAILAACPELEGRAELLSTTGRDISDPFGQGPDVYQACYNQLRSEIRNRLPQFLSEETT